jgi:hypothetical protein
MNIQGQFSRERQSHWLGRVALLSLTLVTTALLPVARAETLPDWNDESAAYAAQGLSTASAQLDLTVYASNRLDTFGARTSQWDLTNTHNDTEGDDLWTAYHMWRRLDGIRQAAADIWRSRAENLARFFTTSYINGAAWVGDASFNHDHIYGWGLCEWALGESDTAAITTIDSIIAAMVSWNAIDGTNPGSSLFFSGAGGRRWARQLRLAVCAAEVSPSSTNIAWRNKVIDIMLQTPDWDATRKAYWLWQGPTDKRLGAGSYANGDRITITFHMGVWMDSLWRAWLALRAEGDSRATSVRQRLIDMATFYRDFPLDVDGLLSLNLGYNINTEAPISQGGRGSPTGVYTIPPVNGLVFAYKLTGGQTYLDHAWTLYKNWQAMQEGQAGVVNHYIDSEIAADNFFLANNKGELQYVYALFENGGAPTLVGSRPNPPGQLRVE